MIITIVVAHPAFILILIKFVRNNPVAIVIEIIADFSCTWPDLRIGSSQSPSHSREPSKSLSASSFGTMSYSHCQVHHRLLEHQGKWLHCCHCNRRRLQSRRPRPHLQSRAPFSRHIHTRSTFLRVWFDLNHCLFSLQLNWRVTHRDDHTFIFGHFERLASFNSPNVSSPSMIDADNTAMSSSPVLLSKTACSRLSPIGISQIKLGADISSPTSVSLSQNSRQTAALFMVTSSLISQ